MMRQLLRAVPLVAGAFIAPRLLPAQTALRGRLFDVYSQASVTGGAITADNGERGASDRDGRFSIACQPKMRVTIRRVGYEPAEAQVTDCGEFLQVGLTPSAQPLNQVSVVDTREGVGAAALEQPHSATTLSRSELRRGTGLFFDESLNLVPGVRFERRTMSGGQRITIRGYGTRSNFDGSGYKAYLNGIPLTDAEGITILDDVDFGSIGRVDVVRGPATSLYGAGIAGVVNMWTLRPERLGTTIEQETMAGQDGLLRSDTRYATASATSTILVNYGHQAYDSYRIHSASRKDFASMVGDFRPSERRTITTFLSYANSRDERAGQIDSAAFFGKRNVGEASYLANDAHVNMETLRLGVTHAYRVNDMFEPVVTAFMSGTTREDIFAAGVTPKSSQTFGGRAVLNVRANPAGRALSGTTGVEFEQTNAYVKGYRYSNAVLGALTNDMETRSIQYSLFSQWDATLPADLVLTAGASVNGIEYALGDRLANTSNPTRQSLSGRKTYDPVFIPRVSLRRRFGESLSLYGTVSQGFTPATSSDAVIPFTGEPNRDLAPERGTLYEVGTKGMLANSRLAYQLALYDLRVTDKLSSQSVFDANGTQLYAYTVNAGDQSNRGVELSVSVDARPGRDGESAFATLRPFINYTYSDYTYTNFRSDNNNASTTVDYSGKRVVGVPEHVLAAGMDAALRSGPYATLSYEWRADMPITYDNTHRAPGFGVLNARVGVSRDVGRNLLVDAYVGGTNLTGSRYYTMVFLNGNYAGGASPSIYLPGAYQARYLGGVKLGWRR